MALVINPRGTGGAGKTWLVQEVMAAARRMGAVAEPLHREGRQRPIGWRFDFPGGRRPLAVLGHYEATRGGTDTIPLTDGGLDEAFRLAHALSRDGHDVLMEGYQLSGEVERTAALARAQRARADKLHVLWLDVPLENCIRNVITRRRAGRDLLPSIERTVRAGHEALSAACQALSNEGVDVERLDTDAALHRVLAMLGLEPTSSDRSSHRAGCARSNGEGTTLVEPSQVVLGDLAG